jgi:hypothetical protein
MANGSQHVWKPEHSGTAGGLTHEARHRLWMVLLAEKKRQQIDEPFLEGHQPPLSRLGTKEGEMEGTEDLHRYRHQPIPASRGASYR